MWILLVLMIGKWSESGHAVDVARFNTKEACQQAEEWVTQVTRCDTTMFGAKKCESNNRNVTIRTICIEDRAR